MYRHINKESKIKEKQTNIWINWNVETQGAEIPKRPRPKTSQLLCHILQWRSQVMIEIVMIEIEMMVIMMIVVVLIAVLMERIMMIASYHLTTSSSEDLRWRLQTWPLWSYGSRDEDDSWWLHCYFNPVIDIIISCDWTDGDEGGGGGGLVDHLASLAVEPPPDYDQVGGGVTILLQHYTIFSGEGFNYDLNFCRKVHADRYIV